jgi:hypothetical protein
MFRQEHPMGGTNNHDWHFRSGGTFGAMAICVFYQTINKKFMAAGLPICRMDL